MKKIHLLLSLVSYVFCACAQTVVVDPQHFAIVVENGSVRSAAENTHNNYLGQIRDNLETVNTNMGSVVIAQTMIYQGLSNVNSALKNGMAVKDMAFIVADILNYSRLTLDMAREEPYLLLFTEQFGRDIQDRAIRLVTDVSTFVLKEGDNVLADYNSRDQLLRRVRQELQIISSLAYGAYRAVFWAREKGIVASLNPYAAWISRDKVFVADIIRNAKYLQQ